MKLETSARHAFPPLLAPAILFDAGSVPAGKQGEKVPRWSHGFPGARSTVKTIITSPIR